MRNQDTPQPNEGVPSTEDLTGARQDPGDEAPGLADAPPEYPGEATTTDREGREESGGRASVSERREEELAKENEPLLGNEQEVFRARWQKIQGEFVDDPKNAVNAADQLVAETMQALATTFAEHKRGLEGQWHRGEEVATEDLRLALQRYRSFFNRLLST
ncbi:MULTISPECIES: hypothetical protein [unclassified Streptomyces]|uniref:hypothetical protein n=1 Tax=unclassified Streptomyces TaxID=2593676 RepID=UPI002259F2EA|nr:MULTISPECIES: hypothetical protein [unclassified Streptomyces]WSP58593.1 hypothetical protein OG306_32605 [Streptomyces sp. NBC_01241]WSU20829.1 hypothetical protein OG508_07390 [Streptomyces sp. NBC_01108]MCX4790368.1 hypothetical protein [Streptomyces sp. NBC_01221]MCX4793906.1 hypothetical protein [Streptomyces sp. NBC_01242]WSJ35322.1 hypothetical protein OG772_04110 [Streptomyces sp. NBC_01321]